MRKFKNYFGNDPTVIAFVWGDLLTTNLELGLDASDKSEKGFRKILIAIYFLWAKIKSIDKTKITPVAPPTSKAEKAWRMEE